MRYPPAKEDYEQEMIELAQKEAHDIGTCEGAPYCAYCLDDKEAKDEG